MYNTWICVLANNGKSGNTSTKKKGRQLSDVEYTFKRTFSLLMAEHRVLKHDNESTLRNNP